MFQSFYTTKMCARKKVLEKRFFHIYRERYIRGNMVFIGAVLALMIGATSVLASGTLQNSVASETTHAADGAEIASEPEEKTEYDVLQESVDNGHQPWRLNVESVAMEFVRESLQVKEAGSWEIRGDSRVVFTPEDGGEFVIDLYQPARKGQGGIWEVERWFDSQESTIHQVRDLTSLPPLFHGDETIPDKYREALAESITSVFSEAYRPYYEVLGFEGSSVTFTQQENAIEVTLILRMINRNYYRDPDTVGYIREAKEAGSPDYQTLYAEYNQPKEINFEIKVTAGLASDGGIDQAAVSIYENTAPKGTSWTPIENVLPQA